MAKVDLKPREDDAKAQIGRVVANALAMLGWSQKEAAARMDRDPAQVARWIAGTERPQLDALWALEELRWPLVQCLARLDAANEVVVEIRRRA